MQNQKVLEKLGYSSKEAKIYLATLKLGEAHISVLATKTNMPRSTVQVVVERLHKDGLMNFYMMRHHKYWTATDPTELLTRLKKQEEMVAEAIPELISLKKKARQHNRNSRTLDDILQLKEVADGVCQPVLIADNEKQIRYVNQAWVDLFEYSFDELVGQQTRILKTDKTPPQEHERLWKTLQTDELFESNAIVNCKKNGDAVCLFTVIFSVLHGNRKFYVQILEDRSSRHIDSDSMRQVFKTHMQD